MNRSDLRPEGRALTVAVALVVAVAGLGLAVLALRDQSASRRTPDAQSSPTGAAAGRVNGLIAFGCGYRICTMVPDGTSVRDVMDGYDKGLVVAGYTPAWSPDGTKLAFTGDDGKTDGLYVMNADGTGFRWLAEGSRPVWSPDGSRILFTMRSGLYTI